MIPFPIPWKLVGIGVAVLAVVSGIWYVRHLQTSNAELTIERDQANANYAALQAAQAHERKIASEASNEFQRTVKQLQAARADTPVRSVRLCRSPTGYVPAPAPAPSGVDAGSSTGLPETTGRHPGYGSGLQTGEADKWSDAGPDIGPPLYSLADEADNLAAQCAALQKWVNSR